MNQQQRIQAAAEIKAGMDRLGYSAATLAELSGVSKNTITRVMRAENVQPSTLRKLRETLGIQPRVEQEFDADVETTALAVKTYLAGLPANERAAAVASLIRSIVSAATHPNG